MASWEELENLLREASNLLDKAAAEILDLGLDPERNVRRIGEAIVLAAEIRNEIYIHRQDLMPEYLRKK
jgi:hypothetical protein